MLEKTVLLVQPPLPKISRAKQPLLHLLNCNSVYFPAASVINCKTRAAKLIQVTQIA